MLQATQPVFNAICHIDAAILKMMQYNITHNDLVLIWQLITMTCQINFLHHQ